MKTIQSIEDKDKQRELFESWRFVASSDSELWGAKVEDTPSRVFEPWFCRVLSELGAEPVGIDIGNLDDEKFEHYNRDLSRKGALDFLPDQTFDFINATQLLTSPSNKRMGNEGHEIIARMKNELQTQARRLLKKGGSIISYGLSGIDDIGS